MPHDKYTVAYLLSSHRSSSVSAPKRSLANCTRTLPSKRRILRRLTEGDFGVPRHPGSDDDDDDGDDNDDEPGEDSETPAQRRRRSRRAFRQASEHVRAFVCAVVWRWAQSGAVPRAQWSIFDTTNVELARREQRDVGALASALQLTRLLGFDYGVSVAGNRRIVGAIALARAVAVLLSDAWLRAHGAVFDEMPQLCAPSPHCGGEVFVPLTATIICAALAIVDQPALVDLGACGAFPKTTAASWHTDGISRPGRVFAAIAPRLDEFIDDAADRGRFLQCRYSGQMNAMDLHVSFFDLAAPLDRSTKAAAKAGVEAVGNNQECNVPIAGALSLSGILIKEQHRLGVFHWRASNAYHHRGLVRTYGPATDPNTGKVCGTPESGGVARLLGWHSIVGVDIGEINVVCCTTTDFIIFPDGTVEMSSTALRVRNAGRRHQQQVRFGDHGAAHRDARIVADRTAAFAGQNSRSPSQQTYTNYSNAVRTDFAHEPAADRRLEAERRRRSFKNRQAWERRTINQIVSMAGRPGQPVLAVGNYRAGNTRRGTRGGAVPSKCLTDAMVRHQLGFSVPEAYSSQKCPFCGSQLRMATKLDVGAVDANAPLREQEALPHGRSRLKACPSCCRHGNAPLLLDRDVAAGLCMTLLFYFEIAAWRTAAAVHSRGTR